MDTESLVLHVARFKPGFFTTHPLRTDELRFIKAWLKKRHAMNPRPENFFISERRGLLNQRTVWTTLRRYAELSGLPLSARPHMLRRTCGFALADQGADTRLIQDYLGHRNIQHTVRYTAANPERFERLW